MKSAFVVILMYASVSMRIVVVVTHIVVTVVMMISADTAHMMVMALLWQTHFVFGTHYLFPIVTQLTIHIASATFRLGQALKKGLKH